jgi:hypothetical protein
VKKIKLLRLAGVMVLFLLSVSSLTFATNQTIPVGKGYLEFKATVPTWVTNKIIISLCHENGTSTPVILEPDQQFETIAKLLVGKYTVEYVEVEGIPTSDYLVEFQHNVIIEKDKGVAYGIRVTGRGARAESTDEIGIPMETMESEENPWGDVGELAPEDESAPEVDESVLGVDSQQSGPLIKFPENNSAGQEERKDLLEGPAGEGTSQSQGSEGDVSQEKSEAEKRQGLGIRFLKRNIFSFLIIGVLCVVTLIIKKRNDTL